MSDLKFLSRDNRLSEFILVCNKKNINSELLSFCDAKDIFFESCRYIAKELIYHENLDLNSEMAIKLIDDCVFKYCGDKASFKTRGRVKKVVERVLNHYFDSQKLGESDELIKYVQSQFDGGNLKIKYLDYFVDSFKFQYISFVFQLRNCFNDWFNLLKSVDDYISLPEIYSGKYLFIPGGSLQRGLTHCSFVEQNIEFISKYNLFCFLLSHTLELYLKSSLVDFYIYQGNPYENIMDNLKNLNHGYSDLLKSLVDIVVEIDADDIVLDCRKGQINLLNSDYYRIVHLLDDAKLFEKSRYGLSMKKGILNSYMPSIIDLITLYDFLCFSFDELSDVSMSYNQKLCELVNLTDGCRIRIGTKDDFEKGTEQVIDSK